VSSRASGLPDSLAQLGQAVKKKMVWGGKKARTVRIEGVSHMLELVNSGGVAAPSNKIAFLPPSAKFYFCIGRSAATMLRRAPEYYNIQQYCFKDYNLLNKVSGAERRRTVML
jgi:hypothetical protein